MPTKPRTLAELKRAKYGRGATDKAYDHLHRDPKLRTFYGSQEWKKVRAYKLSMDPVCQPCEWEGRSTPASQVHHRRKVRTHWSLRLVLSNLLSVCPSCHAAIERREP